MILNLHKINKYEVKVFINFLKTPRIGVKYVKKKQKNMQTGSKANNTTVSLNTKDKLEHYSTVILLKFIMNYKLLKVFTKLFYILLPF